jgi:hypothetical protein
MNGLKRRTNMKYKVLVEWIIESLEESDIWEDDECTIPTEDHEDLWEWACALHNGEVELSYEVLENTPAIGTFDDYSPAVFDFEVKHEGFLKEKWNANDMIRELEEHYGDIYGDIEEWIWDSYQDEQYYANI